MCIRDSVFVDYFKNKEALAVMSIAGILPTLLMAPLAVPITRKYGKKEVGAIGCIIGGIASLLLFVLQDVYKRQESHWCVALNLLPEGHVKTSLLCESVLWRLPVSAYFPCDSVLLRISY